MSIKAHTEIQQVKHTWKYTKNRNKGKQIIEIKCDMKSGDIFMNMQKEI